MPRLVGLRKTARGWNARCPAHDDRSPSLSISVSGADVVLLYCFAGCETARVVSAIGLTAVDLFPPRTLERVARRRRAASDKDVREFIDREIERERVSRLSRSPFDTPHPRSADVNAARARANALYGRQLAPIATYPWEGYAPHDTDPAWPDLFWYACERVAYDRYHFMYPWAPCGDVAPLPMRLFPEAADLAARWLHELAR